MNGYDFDKTIYDGDSTLDFFVYMVTRHVYLLLLLPYFMVIMALYGTKALSKKKTKECMFFFIPLYKNIDKIVEKFWNKNISKVFDWYKKQQKEDDCVISASLSFVLVPAMKRLGISNYFCTIYDTKRGRIVGENCYGKQKVVRYVAKFQNAPLEAFYSDSMSDFPMMRIANEAYIVKNKQPQLVIVPR